MKRVSGILVYLWIALVQRGCQFSWANRLREVALRLIAERWLAGRTFCRISIDSMQIFAITLSRQSSFYSARRILDSGLRWIAVTLLLGLAASNEAHAQSCNVSNAQTQVTGAYDHHRQRGNVETAVAAYRALIAFGGNLPQWSGSIISSTAVPTTAISEAELRSFLNSKNDTWTGWNPVYTALNCLDEALPAVTISDGSAVTEGMSAQFVTVPAVNDDNDQSPPVSAGLGNRGGSPLPEGAVISFNTALTRALGSNETVTLPLTIGGTATLGTDYRLTCRSLEPLVFFTCSDLNGNNPSITFDGAKLKGRDLFAGPLRLEALEDNTSESNETVTLALGGGRASTVTIIDAPASVALSFLSDTYSVDEDYDIMHTVIHVTPAGGRDITVPLIFTNITATGGADYTSLAQVVLKADGITRQSLDIAILDDTVFEGDETFKVAIDTTKLPAGVTAGSITEATVTIVDNDTTASFAAGSSSAAESAGTHNVTVNLSEAAPSGGLTLSYSVAGTATAGSDNDFTIQGSGSLTIAAGETSANIPVAIIDDNVDDDNETVILTLIDDTGYKLGTTTVHTLTITDNDEPPITAARLFSFSVNHTLPEGAVSHFRILISRALGSDETVTLPLTIGGTATLGTDYRLACRSVEPLVFFTCSGLNGNSPSITFDGAMLKGRTLFAGPLHLEALEDNMSESNETVTLTLGTGTTFTATITDAPASVALSFTRDTYSVNEDSSVLTPVISVTPASGRDITVPLIFTNITATGGADYTPLTQVVLKADGQSRYSFDVPILDDTVIEGDETFTMAIDTAKLPAGVTAGSITEATVTIVDNDTTASFAAGSSSAAESAGTHNVTVNLSEAAPSGGLTLSYSVAGTATAGSDNDFTIQGSGSLTIAAGETSANIPVAIIDDNVDDDNETVILTLIDDTGYKLGTTTVHTLTITDNDEPPITAAGLFSLSGNNTLPEGARASLNATFTSTTSFRFLRPTDTVTLPLTIGGTATLGTDYRLTCGVPPIPVDVTCNNLDGNNPSITFDGSRLKSPAERVLSLHLEALEDNTSESNETVTLALGTGRTLTTTITDAPASVALSFTRDTYSVNEDNLVLTPVISVTPASGRDITVPLIFTNITATGGADYTPLTQVVLKADGKTRYSFDVPILYDTVIEGDETFTMAIDTANLPAGVTAGSTTEATVTILDDITASFAAGSSSAAESAGTHNVTVNLSQAASSRGLTLSYSVAGTATAGSDNDFTIQDSGWLMIAAGETSADIPVAINDDSIDDDNETVILTLTDSWGYTPDNTTVHTLTITDNDEPPVSAVLGIISDSPLPEGAVPHFRIRISRALGSDETVTLPLTIGGTATLGTDYRLACRSVEPLVFFTCSGLNGNSPSITFDGAMLKGRTLFAGPLHLEALEDNTSESNETVTLSLGGGRTSTVTIADAPASVALSFTLDNISANENDQLAQPVVTVTPASGRDITVPLIFTDDTATGGVDYTALAQVVLKADGRTRQFLDIPVFDDTVFEGDETFTMAIDTANLPAGVTAGSITEVTVTIVDNDTMASFAASSSSAAESAGTHNVAVNLSHAAPSGGLTLFYSVAGTATAGSGNDFTIQGSGSVTIAAGETSADIPVAIIDDSTEESTETVILTLTDGRGYTLGSTTVHTLTITDNDGQPPPPPPPPPTPEVSFASASSSVGENAGTRNVTVNLSSVAPSGGLTIGYSVAGTATSGSSNDFTIQGSGSVTIAAWETSADIPVAIIDDSTEESTETVILTLTTGMGYTLGTTRTHTVTIVDNDSMASFAASSSSAVESAGKHNVTVNLSHAAPSSGVTLFYSVAGTATSGSSNDFTIQGSGSLTIAAGETSADIPVAINDDSTEESTETVILTLTTGMGYTLGTTRAHTVNIVDNDTMASFAASSSSAVESAGTHNVTVNLSSVAPSSGLTIGYSVAGTATSGSSNDFTIQGSGSLTIAAGETSADIPVAINDDSTEESTETVILTLTTGMGYTLGTTRTHTVTIVDNDSMASFAASSSSAVESAGTHNVTVNLSSVAPSGGLTIGYSVAGTATSGSSNDFTIQGSGSLTIAAGETSADIPVAINDDSTEESTETVILTLTTGMGYTLGTTRAHTVNIVDNDTMASFAASSSSAVESAGTHNVTVNLSSVAPSSGLTIGYSVAGTATSGSSNDFTIQGSGSLTIAAGETSADIPVAINDDSTEESTETVILTLTTGMSYTLGTTRAHTVTIVDNDTMASFAASSSSAVESAGTHNVTVNLSSVAPSSGLTIGYSVAGSATAGGGNDFTIQGSGTLSVAAGATTAAIPVVINDDSTQENAETVILTLTSGTGYTLGSTTVHTLTITDNDGPEISFDSAAGRIREGEVHTVVVNIDPATTLDLTLSYRLLGTALEGEDYLEHTPGMIKIVQVPAGNSQALIRIESISDDKDEPRETVILTLVARQGVSIGTPDTYELTLIDAREASLEAGWSWLVRFGRTVAEQVVDTISQRLRATRIEGTQVNVAGSQVPVGQSQAFGTFEPPKTKRPIDYDSHSQISAQSSTHNLSEREVVQSSSFMSVGESDADGGSLAVWGQASHSSFKGREEDLSLDGDSTAVALGADYAQQAWQAGATLILSEGTGEYNDGVALGEVEASLTSIVPWAAVQATERVQLWGALGTGEGDLQLTEGSITTTTDIDWSMAAAGVRSVLVPASGENSLQLSLVGDALWVETKADPVADLSIPDAEASRLRLGLEGQHSREISSGAEVISRLEFGIREDSGDAETGGGIEIGGGVAWSDARSGLTIELAGRKLLTYDTNELEDEGVSLSFDYDPVPNSAEGLSLSMHQEIGVRSNGGLETLFDSEPLATRTDGEMENRVRLEAAYGVPVLSGQFIAGPQATISRSATTRDYSIGWNVVSARRYEDISLQITAERSESHDRNPEHGISLEINARW